MVDSRQRNSLALISRSRDRSTVFGLRKHAILDVRVHTNYPIHMTPFAPIEAVMRLQFVNWLMGESVYGTPISRDSNLACRLSWDDALDLIVV